MDSGLNCTVVKNDPWSGVNSNELSGQSRTQVCGLILTTLSWTELWTGRAWVSTDPQSRKKCGSGEKGGLDRIVV